MVPDAIILAGGFGSRLRSKVSAIPKPMAPIKNRPFLEYLLDHIRSFDVHTVLLSTGYLSIVIEDHFGYKYKDMTVKYSVEEEPLGTGGAIVKALPQIMSENFLVFNGDTLFKIDINDMMDFHLNKGAEITIALRYLENTQRYGKLVLDRNSKVRNFQEKNRNTHGGWINGGVYLINKSLLESKVFPERFSIESDFFNLNADHIAMYGYKTDAYFIDIGTPDDYEKARTEF